MAEKKCKHCAMMIPKEAKICPHCRKKQGLSQAASIFIIICVSGILISAMMQAYNNPPSSSNNSSSAAEEKLTPKGQKIKTAHSLWSNEDCNTIANKKIHIGMTADQVKAAWGRPYKINETTFSSVTKEQWVMHDSINSSYLYFENGILTAMQQSK